MGTATACVVGSCSNPPWTAIVSLRMTLRTHGCRATRLQALRRGACFIPGRTGKIGSRSGLSSQFDTGFSGILAAQEVLMTQAASETWTFFEGDWHQGNTPIMGVRTHAAWLCSSVFDGARAFEGVVPDLDLHLARINWSAKNFGLNAAVSIEELRELVTPGRAL